MLKVNNLVVNYGKVSALRGINLEVKETEIVTLIGANGAGKTTTLMSISGLVDKTDGSISFMGQDITAMRSSRISALGICHVPEGRHIFPKLTVEENLVAGTFPCKKATKQWTQQQMEQMYELFPRLKERRKQAGGTLSGGEQQMLAMGRGMMAEPKLIMLDEPSLGLAPIIVREIFQLIKKIKNAGKTVLLIEQNASMALQIADRGYVLENGSISLQGSAKDLLTNEAVKRAYLGI